MSGTPRPSPSSVTTPGRSIARLEVEDPHLVTGGSSRPGDPLEPQRLEPQEHLGVHERARVDEQDPHATARPRIQPGCPPTPSSRALLWDTSRGCPEMARANVGAARGRPQAGGNVRQRTPRGIGRRPADRGGGPRRGAPPQEAAGEVTARNVISAYASAISSGESRPPGRYHVETALAMVANA